MASFSPPASSFDPIVRPPTPAPSPGPIPRLYPHTIDATLDSDPCSHPSTPTPNSISDQFSHLPPTSRLAALQSLVSLLTPTEISTLQSLLAPLYKRDFLAELPTELAFHVLSFVDAPRTLARAASVSKRWNAIVGEDSVWKYMCLRWEYVWPEPEDGPFDENHWGPSTWRGLCRYYHTSMRNWLRRPSLLRAHRLPTHTADPSLNTITSAALSKSHLVVALANSRIHVFSARTGSVLRTLTGHDNGVWAVALVAPGGGMDKRHIGSGEKLPDIAGVGGMGRVKEVRPGLEFQIRHNRAPAGSTIDNPRRLDHLLPPSMRRALALDGPSRYLNGDGRRDRDRADATGTARGWGQPGSIVVSGGSDKDLRVWDADTGLCLYVLRGHTSTVRTLRVLHNRPIAISGARDGSILVWDIQHGRLLRRLDGHAASVRALEVCGNKAVSGSYDCTVRLWDVDSGECVHVFRGHEAPIYCVAFDGTFVASGGVDTTVRVCDAKSGECLMRFSVHTALVCQLQLAPGLLISGGADGRVVLYTITPPTPTTSTPTTSSSSSHPHFEVAHRLTAHDSSITALQLTCDNRLLVTSGNDGRARLWDIAATRPQPSLSLSSLSPSTSTSTSNSSRTITPSSSNGPLSGRYVREMSEGGEGVWGVVFRREGGAVLAKRQGKMVVEMWGFGGEVERGDAVPPGVMQRVV
ncbi:WD40 repeat-like protein [Peniophora sp. CONT]|nr:WD40 repeat-like protein [Peniophora sp. CONT]